MCDICWLQEPTQDERDALNNYFHLMSRLYPCGECAAEFQLLLKKFPPQVSFFHTQYRAIDPNVLIDIFTTSRCHLVSSAFFFTHQTTYNSRICRLCAVHNEVNKRLGKPEFDCAHLDETYDCGCGDEPINSPAGSPSDPMDLEVDPSKDRKTGMGLVKGGRAVSL